MSSRGEKALFSAFGLWFVIVAILGIASTGVGIWLIYEAAMWLSRH